VFIVHVFVHVKPESVDAFREATVANARQSVQPRAPMRRQGCAMRRGHSHGAIPEE